MPRWLASFARRRVAWSATTPNARGRATPGGAGRWGTRGILEKMKHRNAWISPPASMKLLVLIHTLLTIVTMNCVRRWRNLAGSADVWCYGCPFQGGWRAVVRRPFGPGVGGGGCRSLGPVTAMSLTGIWLQNAKGLIIWRYLENGLWYTSISVVCGV